MHIVIDVQGAQTGNRFRGIGRYTLSFAKALVRNRGDHDVTIVLNGLLPAAVADIRRQFADLLPAGRVIVWYAPGPVALIIKENRWRYQVAALLRESFIASLNPDIVHICSFMDGYQDNAVTSIGLLNSWPPVSVTLHDLIPMTNPADYLRGKPVFEAFYVERVSELSRASLYLAISDFTRQVGINTLGLDPDSVINVGAAADSIFCPTETDDKSDTAPCKTLGIVRPFVLHTGGADRRKNLLRLIAAFGQLPGNLRRGLQLVFAGSVGRRDRKHLMGHAKSVGLSTGELVMPGYISDEALVRLYRSCKLFVFPSWHEGFGLPALEAMACGAPVIAARGSSLDEVVGLEEALFDPRSTDSIASKLGIALSNDRLRERLIQNGKHQAARFSWDRTAKAALRGFERIHAEAKPAEAGSSGEKDLVRAIADIAGQTRATPCDLARIARSIELNQRVGTASI